MQWQDRLWHLTARGADLFGFWGIGGIGALMGLVATGLAAVSDTAPKLTSVGWMFVFFAATICSTALLGVAGWAYHRWRPQGATTVVSPSAGLAGASGIATFATIKWQTQKTHSGADFVVNVTVEFAKTSRNVVLLGRWAQAIFSISNAKWRWSVTHRLIERNIAYSAEKIPSGLEIVRRPADNKPDQVLMLSDQVTLGTGAGTANLFRVELILSCDGEEPIRIHKAWQFFPHDAGKLSHPVHLEDITYVKDS